MKSFGGAPSYTDHYMLAEVRERLSVSKRGVKILMQRFNLKRQNMWKLKKCHVKISIGLQFYKFWIRTKTLAGVNKV
jgi:hypothetical protein